MAKVQVYAFDKDGKMLHCAPREIPVRFGPGTIRRWEREWRKWALNEVPADCPTGIAVRTRRHGSWLVEWPASPVYYAAKGHPMRPAAQEVTDAR